ncbi:DEAD/DEAH box helicase [Clostridium gasigenes]|uniref:DEAD/DEAH box helicase n=1 Tax=Clostridium gasigenes TaxID=94869 RepID=UPI001C0C6ED7|nr:SNF2 helicase associated domain-containing protein [Clostridium gasigenes]MBU3105401.1 SNF2 helicase associated domain-containing protein [Clostridium gasigenes]
MNIKELIEKLNKNVTSKNLKKSEVIYSKDNVVEMQISDLDNFMNINGLSISSSVLSDNKRSSYDADFSVDIDSGRVIDTECDCLDYRKNNDWSGTYMCNHIAAMYHVFIENLKKEIEINNSSEYLEKTGEKLLNDIEALYRQKEKIKLEVNLHKKAQRNLEYFEVDFKIGNKRMYVLKNLRDFTLARLNNTPLQYGKDFIYDSNINDFEEKDENIVEFIEDFIITKGLLTEQSYGFDSGSSKQLKLSISSLRRFLEIVSHKKIHFEGKEVGILKEDLPLDLKISIDAEEKYSLELLTTDIVPLSLKKDVFIYNDNIYLPCKNQIDNLKIISNNIEDRKKVLFKKENVNRIFNDLIPMLENTSKKIEYDNSLKAVEKNDLEVYFYFDENRKTITLDVKLKYGEEELLLIENENENKDKIIIRDKKKETEVLRTIENMNISIQNKKFVFNGDEEELYNLLTEGYKELDKYGEVYYSERFKSRKIYKTPSIKADIKENDNGYLDFSFNIEDINPKEYKNILSSFRNKRKFHKLKDNSFINLEDDKLNELLGMMDKIVSNEKEINNIRLHKNRSVLLNEFVNRKNLEFIKGSKVIKDTVKKLENINDISYELPKDLDATLREYQVDGFKWFKNLSYLGFGGVLADEMGLGKTLQAISFILSEKGKKTLIVAPTSLIYNWKNEFEKFAPTLKIAIVHGNKEERDEIIKKYIEYDVLLTTYGTLRNDEESYKDIIFDHCIIDEAQNIKNPLAQSTKKIKDIKAKVKFALTGTPIENNLIDIWSIFDFVMPEYLYNNSEFKKRFIDKEEGSKELQKYIKPFMLRRLKKDVIKELPEKIEKKHYIDLTKEQKKVYSAFVKDIKEKMEDESFEGDKITIFSYLTKLRQLCLEPSLLIEGYKGGNGKLEASLEIIKDAIENNHKILLFSQFTSVISVIGDELEKNNIEYSYLDGKTKASKRLELVEEFNNSEKAKVFLISLKAGGTGLNLTSADIVIHFDPWWNPAIEEQASDRAHRIGQKKVVEVIKLIAQGTIEERIINLQEEKKDLINNVMSGGYEGANILSTLSNKDLMDLFV